MQETRPDPGYPLREKNIPFLALWASRFLFFIAGKPLEGEGKGEGGNQTAYRLPPFSCSAKLQNQDEKHDLSYETKSENRSSDGPELYNPRAPVFERSGACLTSLELVSFHNALGRLVNISHEIAPR